MPRARGIGSGGQVPAHPKHAASSSRKYRPPSALPQLTSVDGVPARLRCPTHEFRAPARWRRAKWESQPVLPGLPRMSSIKPPFVDVRPQSIRAAQWFPVNAELVIGTGLGHFSSRIFCCFPRQPPLFRQPLPPLNPLSQFFTTLIHSWHTYLPVLSSVWRIYCWNPPMPFFITQQLAARKFILTA